MSHLPRGPRPMSAVVPPLERIALERIVLDVEDGLTPSEKPAVRIFLGTESAQQRAERIFLWSIRQVRDPARVYEIHLMKNLEGFDGRRWLTGFTNYRFAIPDLAGRRGRAIYNDVDQIYLADPGELFDTPMGSHGFLTIPPLSEEASADTSVMLLDCERMASVWTLAEARTEKKNTLLARARALPGLRGDLDPGWNACDDDYQEGRSKLLHYSTIHTQPWRPVPERFAYQRNPVAALWFDLEESADQAGYQIFDADHPSASFRALCDRKGSGLDPRIAARQPTVAEALELAELIEFFKPSTVLEWNLGVGDRPSAILDSSEAREGAPTLVRYDPASSTHRNRASERYDLVVCLQALDLLGGDDLPWVIDELFGNARSALFAVVSEERRGRRSPGWWFDLFAEASVRHPSVHWRLSVRRGRTPALLRRGGPPLTGPPRVWLLSDGKVGHDSQSSGLAEALGWPTEVKELRFTRLASLQRRIWGPLGRLDASLRGLDQGRSDPLRPPWPDVVIACGWRPAPVARWIAAQSRGHTRLVQLGRQGSWLAPCFDAVVTCRHFGAPPHEHRIETLLPLHRASPERLAEAAKHWPDLFGSDPKPHLLLLVGGTTRRYELGVDEARAIAGEVRELAESCGGSVVAVTSPRTGEAATDAIAEALGETGRVDRFDAGRRENPYLGFLATADAIIVTGESESMLAEALATGVPVTIRPLSERPVRPLTRLQDRIVARSQAEPLSRRGRTRPQQGVELFCARLVERGLVRPRRDMDGLHRDLIEGGYAHALGDPFTAERKPGLFEVAGVAQRLRRRLALGDD